MLKNDVIKRCIEKHGNKYDYSLLPDKVLSKNKHEIICKEHGVFIQNIKSHYTGSNCPKCAIKLRKQMNPNKTEWFIKKCNKIFKNKYDYSITEYINSKSNISYTCKKHGIVTQLANSHLQGFGCSKCSFELKKQPRYKYKNKEYLISELNKIHGNKYQYLFDNLPKTHDYIKINCEIHGIFYKQLHIHKNLKVGCPKCSKSHNKLEQIIEDWLLLNNIQFIRNTRKIISSFELDFYCQNEKIAIEVNGLYWHNENKVGKYYHNNKLNMCLNKNITLIQIFEDDIINHEKILNSYFYFQFDDIKLPVRIDGRFPLFCVFDNYKICEPEIYHKSKHYLVWGVGDIIYES